jgi:hypothetical protein
MVAPTKSAVKIDPISVKTRAIFMPRLLRLGNPLIQNKQILDQCPQCAGVVRPGMLFA